VGRVLGVLGPNKVDNVPAIDRALPRPHDE
jgi:hypothetical protein